MTNRKHCSFIFSPHWRDIVTQIQKEKKLES